MPRVTLLALATLLACDGGGGSDDTSGDDTADTSDTEDTADTSDTDTADTDTGDTADTDIPPDADFVANGPGVGTHWAVVEPVFSPNPCGIGVQNSLYFPGDDETAQVQSVSTSLMEFALALQAVNNPGTVVCEWTAANALFTCDTSTTIVNMNNLPPPYNLDAVVTSTLTANGRFRERIGEDPETSAAHTFGTRWAADIDLTYSRSCAGAHCSSAAAGAGVTSFPCTSEFTLETVNYSDPTLTTPL